MSIVYHTPITLAAPVNSAIVNDPLGDLDQAILDRAADLTNVLTGVTAFTQLNLGATTTLTIAAGAITITGSRHRIDTEAAAAADDLDTVNGSVDGDVLRIQIVSAARVVTIRHNGAGTGNIRTSNGDNIILSSLYDTVDLLYDATNSVWIAAKGITGLNGQDLMVGTDVPFNRVTFPYRVMQTSGAGTGSNKIFAAVAPSGIVRVTRSMVASSNTIGLSNVAAQTNEGTPSAGNVSGGSRGMVYVNFAPVAALNNHAGFYNSAGLCTPEMSPLLFARVTPITLANRRVLVMLHSAPPVNDETSGILIGFRYLAGTDTNWMAMVRDGATLATLDTGVLPISLGINELLCWIDGTVAYFSVNGGTPVSISTNVPTGSTLLGFQCDSVNTSAAARDFGVGIVYIEHD